MIASRKIPILESSVEAEKLADIYISENILPTKYRTDGLHIALATVNDLDMIISLNFQHINKVKTKIMTGNINIREGYKPIYIASPMEV